MSTTSEMRPRAAAPVPAIPLAARSMEMQPAPRAVTPVRADKIVSPAPAPDVDHEAWLATAFTQFVDAETSLPRYVVRHPRRVTQAVRALRALPVIDAVLPPTAEAAAVRHLLLQHGATRRVMLGVSAVLTVPTAAGTYCDGHERATVRRKIRAAEKQAITVRPVLPDERERLLALANAHELTNERTEYRIAQPDNDDLLDYALWLVALDGDGHPIMLSVTPTAGEWGVLRYFRTLVPGQASSDARYLMARELAEALCERGVRHLVDSSRPHWLPNGLRHFQRMIGFRLVRVRRVRVVSRLASRAPRPAEGAD